MVIRNPRNAMNIMRTFSIASIVITLVNERDLELYDVIVELISNNLKYNIVVFEQDIILEFENLNEPNEAQFIEK
jgi:hypothetical protein